MNYSEGFREATVKKMLEPGGRGVSHENFPKIVRGYKIYELSSYVQYSG